MDNEKQLIMDKIKKLLRLGESTNENEASLAMEKAGELMEKYNITHGHLKAKLDLSNIEELSIKAGIDMCRGNTTWEWTLAGSVAKVFDGQVIGSSDKNLLNFIAEKEDMELIMYFFQYIRHFLYFRAKLNFKKEADRKTYGLSAVTTVTQRLAQFRKGREKIQVETGTEGLVLVKKDLVSQLAKQNHPFLRNVNTHYPKSFSHEAYNRGVNDGNSIQLNRPIGEKKNGVIAERRALNGVC